MPDCAGIELVCEVSSVMLPHTRLMSVGMSAQQWSQFRFGLIWFASLHDTSEGLLGYNLYGWASSAPFENTSSQRKTNTSDDKDLKAY